MVATCCKGHSLCGFLPKAAADGAKYANRIDYGGDVEKIGEQKVVRSETFTLSFDVMGFYPCTEPLSLSLNPIGRRD